MKIYRERVLPSIGNLTLPLLLFLSVFVVMLPLNIDLALPLAIVFALSLACLMFFSSPIVVVTETELIVKGARIDRKFLGDVSVIPKEQLFEALGKDLNANAWLSIQASVKGLVKIEITDPEDSSPYWMVSTRQPEVLAKTLKT